MDEAIAKGDNTPSISDLFREGWFATQCLVEGFADDFKLSLNRRAKHCIFEIVRKRLTGSKLL